MKRLLLGALLSSTILTAGVQHTYAVTPTQAQPGVLDRTTPDARTRLDRLQDAKPATSLVAEPKREKPEGKPISASFTEFNFRGATVLPEAELRKVRDTYLNRPITNNDIAELKYKLTKLFYDKGYILVRVTTPPQDISDNQLEFVIYEAKVGEITVEDKGLLRSYVSNGYTKRVESGQVFRERHAESMINDFNDLKNINATLNLRPGQQFGTTDLVVDLDAADEDVQYVAIDNYGSPLTGEIIASAHFEKSNLLKMGETFTADLRHSEDDLWSIKLANSTPIGFYNTRFEISVLHSENDIGDYLKPQRLSGETNSVSVGFANDILNRRDRKLTVRAGLDARTHESFNEFLGPKVTDSKDDIRQLYLNLNYLERRPQGLLYAELNTAKGLDIWDANDKGDLLATNRNADPDALLVRPLVYANILSPFTDGNFKVVGSGQLSSNEVLSSDLFILGGFGSVRGFDLAQLTGDSGYQVSLEYNHNLPQWSDKVSAKVGPFIDGGRVFNRRKSGVNTYEHLLSAGIGLEVNADLIPTGQTRFRFDWAHPTGSYDVNGAKDPTIDNNVFLFRVTQNF